MKNRSIVELEQSDHAPSRPLQSRSGMAVIQPMREIKLPVASPIHDEARHMIAWRLRIVSLLRILCGIVCLYDAWNTWQRGFSGAYLLRLAQGSMPLAATWFSWWLHLAQLNMQGFGFMVLLLECALGFCLISGALTRLACGAGILLTLTGSMGAGLLNGASGQSSSDVGLLVVLSLAFLGLLLSDAGRHFGLDRWLQSAK